MQQFFYKVMSWLVGIVSVSTIQVQTYNIEEIKINIPVILYHEFTKEEPDVEKYSLISTPEKFEKDILTLLENEYTIISFEEIVGYIYNRHKLPQKCIVITFDDGYLSNYEMIYPILKKYNIPASIFVVNNTIGKENHFSWENAKEMEESGLVKIYSHGNNHVDCTSISIEDFINEITIANEGLARELGHNSQKIFSYPNGKYNEETIKTLKDMGYMMQMTTVVRCKHTRRYKKPV